MSVEFIGADRRKQYLLPPSVEEWLPEGHLARFVVEIVSMLDLTVIIKAYSGRGSKPFHPGTLLSLLFYGYATGVFSSRKLEAATYDSVAFRYICANTHPDHDTIATFRKRFLPELKPLFLQVLLIAREMGVLKVGNISLDGTKVKANASKHRALSWGHACRLEQQLQAEVAELLAMAERADTDEQPDGLDIPEELARRQARLEAIAKAKAELEHRAAERYTREQAEYDEKVARRSEKEHKTGQKARGKKPKPPIPGPRKRDQVNLTDEESRIMPVSGGGFEQTYNAQAGVDMDSGLLVEGHVSQQPNDKKELAPALQQLGQLPTELGKPDALVADSGYYSEANVNTCEQHRIQPYIAAGRQEHNPPLGQRHREPPPLPEDADAVTRMHHHLQTEAGRALYARRKTTIEPVFGIIKAVMGFRQFLLRGIDAVSSEWDLVCIAYNIKKLHVLAA
jgi:transposase